MLNGKSVLITGGTGEIGRELISTLLQYYPKINKIVVYSRDEKKHQQLSSRFPIADGAPIRYFIGDVRDKDRLTWACKEMDVVFHLAGLSSVDSIEYNPFEALKTNIQGTQNLIEACRDTNVTDVISVSLGNSCSPTTLFEASKIFAEKLMLAANNIVGERKLKFSVARLPYLFNQNNPMLSQINSLVGKKIVLGHSDYSRFYMTTNEAVRFIIKSIIQHWGGEVFIPKCLSYSLKDYAHLKNTKIEVQSGAIASEPIHEELFSQKEHSRVLDLDKYFVLLPLNSHWDQEKWMEHFKAKKFEMLKHSSENVDRLALDKLKNNIVF